MIPLWALLLMLLGLLLVLVALAWALWRLSQLFDARAFEHRTNALLIGNDPRFPRSARPAERGPDSL